MEATLPSQAHWAALCAADGEFRIAARHWSGGLRFDMGERTLALSLTEGVPSPDEPADGVGLLSYHGSREVWRKLLSSVPPRFHNDLLANLSVGLGLSRSGDPLLHVQYYGAVMRALELLREACHPAAAAPDVRRHRPGQLESPSSPFEAAVGRYVHLELDGHDHRVYFEEAGQGVPVLLQHTAGCHGSQWRHLLEEPRITEHFRLIAYDLPCHGKSLPPTSRAWWNEPYRLSGEFLRSVPLGLGEVLGLERPVFLGCSVGGLLALDLASRHPDRFRAVVALEGALKVEGDLEELTGFWHPQVSNEYKARAMEGLMSPTSPDAFRKETSFVYAAGWPPVFLGDLYYYLAEYDLREAASHIDTARVGVHILCGEYDYSGRIELGRAAHEAIPGSTFTEMAGMGHFPMSENPQRFLEYLLPVLNRIRGAV